MKIVTFADLHLGNKSNGNLDPKTGLNTRVLDALNSLDYMIDYCLNNNIQNIICAGDIYHNNMPTPNIQQEFNKRMNILSKHNINTYIMSGNHDVSSTITNTSALTVFDTLEIDNIYHSRFYKKYNLNNIDLIMLPTYTNEEEVKNIINKINKPSIIVGHFTLLGAKLNDYLIEKNESNINMNIFNNKNIICVILGHLHKYQIMNTKPLIYYCGSLQRIDFNEERQKKGFIELEIENNKLINYKFIEVPSQTFVTIKYDLTNSNDATEELINQINKNKDKLNNSIIRFKLKLKKDTNINYNILNDKLHLYKIKSLSNISKDIDEKELIIDSNINENINEKQALQLYFKDDKKMIKLGLDMIDKLQQEGKI